MTPSERHLGDFRTWSCVSGTIRGSNLRTHPPVGTVYADPKEITASENVFVLTELISGSELSLHFECFNRKLQREIKSAAK